MAHYSEAKGTCDSCGRVFPYGKLRRAFHEKGWWRLCVKHDEEWTEQEKTDRRHDADVGVLRAIKAMR